MSQEDDLKTQRKDLQEDEAVSLEDLARAFAEATGQPFSESPPEDETPGGESVTEEIEPAVVPDAVSGSEDHDLPPTPKSVLEALLFVGHPHNQPLSPAEATEIMRGVQLEEIAHLVTELNSSYEATGRPYRIVFEQGGYRMKLLPEFDELREGFFGKVRHVRLSQQALEVLAIVAYKQPITVKEVNRMRGRPSGALLAQLVRRDLLTVSLVDEVGEKKATPKYRTTQRFLEVFGLESLEDLPQLGESSLICSPEEDSTPTAASHSDDD